MEHEKYKQEIDHSKSNIVKYGPIQLIAKPKSKNNYCNVCKNDFDDYLEVQTGLFSISNRGSTRELSKTTGLMASLPNCVTMSGSRLKKWSLDMKKT